MKVINRFTGGIFLSEQFLSLPCGVLRYVFFIGRSRFPGGKGCARNDRAQFLYLAANEAKQRGRRIKMRPDWNDRKITIMHNLLVHKVNENPELSPKLLDTSGAVLAEGNTWHDNYWGCCSCPRCGGKRGRNNLGRLLMQLRADYMESIGR